MVNNMSGTIVTFYSYKGGTGRTMALSNVAWIMASNGHKVLLVDWDLESPGLHRYLRPFLRDPELIETAGIIDFLSRSPDGENVFSILKDYILELDCRFRKGGSVAFLPAGRQDENYAVRVNTVNWANSTDRFKGADVASAVRRALTANYDYILIDSPTGVGDISGICTVKMPDLLVLPFTLNHQNIRGAARVAAYVRAERGEAFPIFPVPTRIEEGERDKLAAAMAYARQTFAPFLLHVQSYRGAIDSEEQAKYWREVETPYVSFYAFEEMPAAFRDESGGHRGLLAPAERLVSRLTDRLMSLHSEGEEWRNEIVRKYAFDVHEAIKRRATLPKGESGPVWIARNIVRWLDRRGWQLAAVVLAGAILVNFLYGMFSPVVDVNEQLAGPTEDLRRIETFASEHASHPNFPKFEFADAQDRIQAIRNAFTKAQPKLVPRRSAKP
jgi:MinD-like ATPase involved in chromosome partitioning or flagellar assembly